MSINSNYNDEEQIIIIECNHNIGLLTGCARDNHHDALNKSRLHWEKKVDLMGVYFLEFGMFRIVHSI